MKAKKESGVQPPQSKERLYYRLEIVLDRDSIVFEAVNRLDLRCRRGALKPRRGTPRVLVGDGHQSVLDRVVMDVIEAGKIGLLEGQRRVPEVEPHLTARRFVASIDFRGRAGVEVGKKGRQLILD